MGASCTDFTGAIYTVGVLGLLMEGQLFFILEAVSFSTTLLGRALCIIPVSDTEM